MKARDFDHQDGEEVGNLTPTKNSQKDGTDGGGGDD